MVTPVMASLYKWQFNCLKRKPSNVSLNFAIFSLLLSFLDFIHHPIFQRTVNNTLFRIPDDGQSKKNSVIPRVIHHRQNPVESTSPFLSALLKQLENNLTDFNKISYCDIKIAVFWFVTPCSFEDSYRNFVGIYCLKMVVCSVSAHKTTQR
jgi:hypothetical protein